MRINFVTGACRAHYGAVLTWQGRWADAERELTEATEDLARRPTWSGLAIVRLAELRRRQGRIAEAQELLHRAQGNALTPVVLAELSLDLGDASAAGDLLETVLRRVAARNRSLRAAPLEVMVRAKAASGEAEAAVSHLVELRSIADAVGTRPLRAALSHCEGLVAAAAGDPETAREGLEDAVELFAASGAAFELARAQLELARVLASLGRQDAAVREATLAVRRLDEVGAAGEAARARELLGSLGAPPMARRAARSGQLLTPRELEVLRLVSEGLTDGEIAARLVLSRHTVHRHLQNTYAKLGCGSRISAVALRKLGVTLLGHFLGADGRRARFAPDLGESVAWGDERNAQLMGLVRKLIAERGLPRPEILEPEPFDADAPEELNLSGFGAVLFAGGFRPDYESWVRFPGAFDELGFPVHEEGASTVAPGLYFVGVHFLRKRKSSLLNGVGEDAAIVARQIAARQVQPTA